MVTWSIAASVPNSTSIVCYCSSTAANRSRSFGFGSLDANANDQRCRSKILQAIDFETAVVLFADSLPVFSGRMPDILSDADLSTYSRVAFQKVSSIFCKPHVQTNAGRFLSRWHSCPADRRKADSIPKYLTGNDTRLCRSITLSVWINLYSTIF
nr:hypothetical protein CFP56_16246 [Quercus suber]